MTCRMMDVPAQAMIAMKSGTTPVAFVQFAVHGKTWRYCGTNRDVDWSGHLWSNTPSVRVDHVNREFRPAFLTPIPASPKSRMRRQSAATTNLREHWKMTFTNPEGDWRCWFDQIGRAECDVSIWDNVPFDSDKWFTIQTLKGKAVAASMRLLKAVGKSLGSISRWGSVVDYEGHQDLIYYGFVKASITHPSMMKSRDFEHQQEFRFVWVGKGEAKRVPFEVYMGSNAHCARII